jgi:hypothetical protein
MTKLLASLLPYIIIGLIILAAFMFVLALQQLRRGRTGEYWRIRRAAGQRGGQLFLLSIGLFGVAAALALFSGLADLAYQRLTGRLNSDPDAPKGVALPTLTAVRPNTFTLTPTLETLPTRALTVTSTATTALVATTPPTNTPIIITNTPLPAATNPPTATLSPTATPSVTPTASATFETLLVLTPQPSSRQPRSGATVELVAAASSVSPDQQPIEPSKEFPAGIERIYLFFDYQRMDDGISWSRILFRDGVPIQGQSYIWSLGESGSSYFFFGSDEGYPAGQYEVRLYLGENEISRYELSILPPT